MFDCCGDGESMTSWNDVEGCLMDILSLEKPMSCDIFILMIWCIDIRGRGIRIDNPCFGQ